MPYKVTVDEDTPIGTTIFSEISVTDADTVGDFIEVFCEDLLNGLEGCDTFAVSTIDSLPSSYHGALVLMKRLDFATKTEYELILRAVVRYQHFLLYLIKIRTRLCVLNFDLHNFHN